MVGQPREDMDGPDEVTSGTDADAATPYLSSREAADTLLAAVQRAGPSG
jgi:hypothetical protein